ncbi:universal stress protein [Aestuariispira insulae]|uniref:Universal stress protein family protein n=1 Tax=Aestuariispira insulae TaxID=1461337 RepID=A0A3D9HGC2_9PROT|nr:universal stress protein [Aestuariispira insulae]RED48510.1 universal stress protein family protein [Aestuariispira insulae]
MRIKSILVHLEASERGRLCLETAINLAGRFDAHLTGLAVKSPFYIPSFAAAQVPPDIYTAMNEEQDLRIAKAKEVFDDVVRANNRQDRSQWVQAEGDIATAITDHSRFSDLVILGQEDEDKDMETYQSVPDNVILSAGRPVLVVPYIGTQAQIGQSVMIAWDGSREAARAVYDARPILEQASSITILSANPKRGEDAPGADLARYLSEHDIGSTIQKTVSDGVSVGDLLLNEISEGGYDLAIMGGYGHLRLREMILGGVTRHMLEHMTIPVIFSH